MTLRTNYQYILVFGNPVDGITCYGPFETSDAAHSCVEDSSAHKSDYWVVTLYPPENL